MPEYPLRMDISGTAPSYRLPGTSRPHAYDLRLAPDLDHGTFTGDERIEITVVAPSATLVLNAIELEIGAATLHDGWASDSPLGTEETALDIALDTELEMATLTAPHTLAPGKYTLVLAFSGSLNDKLCGFYRSRFTDAEGHERIIATTQFEETDARRAFPCYDEPDHKATFAVTLDVAEGLGAFSNAPEVERTPLAGAQERVRFAPTMVMSTYLVAFVVGPLEATPPVDAAGTPVRVVTVPGKGHLTAPALECAVHALGFFAEYFGIPYPGEKLDLIAIPDFAAGAMENLGCVTFREAILLADPENSARAELERLAEVVEHEIAHMWFGDLVTMKWWNGIWLNEAFATFMALCCQDDFRPEWQTFVGFSRSKGAALAVDGLHATRPIEFPVHHPDDAAAMFDVLTYEKGASVLWMLEQYLGRDRFRAGVRTYLAQHAYGNTETTDLWDAIEGVAEGEPVRELMDTWIFQGGYPLVEARARPDAPGVVELRQTPFSYLPSPSGEESSIGREWLVPVIYGSGPSPERTLLGATPTEVKFTGLPLFNAGGSGFYRLGHDTTLLTLLLDHLDELSATERYNLVADTWAATVACRSPLTVFTEVVARLGNEEDPNVWAVVIGAVGLLDLVAAPERRSAVAQHIGTLLAPVFARVGWEARVGEDEQVPLLRASLVAALGNLAEDAAVIAEARRRFTLDIAGSEELPADLASAILGVVAAHATPEEFAAILTRYRTPRSPADEVRHLNALPNVRDPALATTVRELCRTEVRSQNAPYVLGAMLRSRDVGPDTFAFITEHFDELAERFPDNSIHRMLEGVSGLVHFDATGHPLLLEEVRTFVRARVPGARARLVEQSLERLDVNVRFAVSVREQLGNVLPG